MTDDLDDDREPPEWFRCACQCGCATRVDHEGEKCGMCSEACFCGTWEP